MARANGTSKRTLRERFPALTRLERQSSRAHVPFVRQLQMADCGPAALTMVLRYFGRNVSAEDVRVRVGVGRDGATALQLIQAARVYGLMGRAIRLDMQDLDYLRRG